MTKNTQTALNQSIKAYQEELKSFGYCKLFNSKSNNAQICCYENSKNPQPPAWLVEDFLEYCHENKLEIPTDFTAADLMRTLPVVCGTIFDPEGGTIIKRSKSRSKYLNSYSGFERKYNSLPMDESFHRFFKAFIKNEAERHILFQYIAHMVQRPQERPSWHIMMPSAPGTGKGFLMGSILTPLVVHAKLLRKFTQLNGQFSTVLEDSILIWLDDCKVTSYDTQIELKSILSEEQQYTEHKNMEATMVRCYARMILASNEFVPLYIDAGERRWCIFERLEYCDGMSEIEGKKHRLKNYIEPLSNWLKLDGAIEAIYDFFLNYSLEGFNHKSVPYTESFKRLVEDSKRDEQVKIEEWIENFPDNCKWFKFKEAEKLFEQSPKPPASVLLKSLLHDCGYQSHRFQNSYSHMGTLWFPQTMTKEDVIKQFMATSF